MQALCTCVHGMYSNHTSNSCNITHLVQDFDVQDGFKWDVWSYHGWAVVESAVGERGGDDELRGSKERPEVAAEIFPLLTSLAAGSRPQLDGVCGDPHVSQSPGRGHHQYQAAQQHNARMQHAEGAPAAEAAPQVVLKTFAQPFTARRVNWVEE